MGCILQVHYSGAIMNAMASQITGVWIVCWTVCSSADQRKPQNSAPLPFVRGIHWWAVDSPHKGPVNAESASFKIIALSSSCTTCTTKALLPRILRLTIPRERDRLKNQTSSNRHNTRKWDMFYSITLRSLYGFPIYEYEIKVLEN